MIKIQKPMSETSVKEVQETIPVAPAPREKSSPSSEGVPSEARRGSPAGNFLARLKRIKNIEIYAAVAVIGVMVLIFFSSIGGSTNRSRDNTPTLNQVEHNFVREMEQKLVAVLSNVRGAGRVNAMVTAVGSATLEIAYNIDEKTVTQNGSGGSSTSTTTVVKTPVLINGRDALVLMEIKPQLKGVVIVATGAHDPAVRLNLLRAVQALVADPRVNVEVLARN